MRVPQVPIWTTDGPVDMALQGVEVDGPKTTPFERRFNPYDFNGGCVRANHFIWSNMAALNVCAYFMFFFSGRRLLSRGRTMRFAPGARA